MVKYGVFKIACAVILLNCFLGAVSNRVIASENCFIIVADGSEYRYYYPQINYTLQDGAVFLGLDEEVEKIVADKSFAPINASLTFNPENQQPFTFIEGKLGRELDAKALKAKVEYALQAGVNKVVVNGVWKKPNISVSDLKKQTFLRAQFQTSYEFSIAERKSNIALAVRFISGKTLLPGEEFSFNQTVGLRVEERGFLPAKIIQEGKFTDGVGGGVCQVSTTLYNCALLAGLKISEINKHSLQVNYAPPSFDAMVSDFFSDLKFINDGNSPVYIAGVADGKTLTFKIYGEQLDCRYECLSQIIEIIPAQTVTKKKILGNEVDVVKKDGVKSEGYLNVYKNGELIESRKIRSDIYNPVEGVIYVD